MVTRQGRFTMLASIRAYARMGWAAMAAMALALIALEA
jgi:hypothetical protein